MAQHGRVELPAYKQGGRLEGKNEITYSQEISAFKVSCLGTGEDAEHGENKSSE